MSEKQADDSVFSAKEARRLCEEARNKLVKERKSALKEEAREII